MHKTFISYHHDNEQDLKNEIIKKYGNESFIDKSVSDGDIDPDCDEEGVSLEIGNFCTLSTLFNQLGYVSD